ncbi:hypothetical protein PVMG_02547 [Plasmodium vivax Mauritania I]|uniref:Variable surface protein n=1 Tax=Plasmodium vivax Mauritania I TaxID=1035515 RepID=A0A0J9W343_PLAVI|nr:hypothetical protein PVMG_02547 [Plasmodium vivax Mauritania I]
MLLSKNNHINENLRFFLFIEIFMIIILIWIYIPYNMCSFGKSLDSIYSHEIKNNTIFKRSLAKHEFQRNLKYQSHRENLYDIKKNKSMKDDNNNKPTYEYLKKGLNDLESYKKDYNNRYIRKKGIAKLDCYYEKKVFDLIDEIYALSRKMNNSKKALKKKMYKKFGYRHIFFSSLPLFGLILHVLFSKFGPFTKYCPSDCSNKHGVTNPKETIPKIHQAKQLTFAAIDTTTLKIIVILHDLLFIILSISAITVTIYTLIKIIKYERLKSGKGKMNMKEYCQFCKDLINNKTN